MPLMSPRKRRIGALTLSHATVDFYAGFYAPLIPILAATKNIPLPQLTMLAGASIMVCNCVQPLSGLFMHRLRRPWLLYAGPLLAMGMALLGVVPGLAGLVVLLVLSQAGVGAFHPQALLVAHAVSGDRDRVGVPIFLSGGFFGMSLGSLVASAWAVWFGFDRFWLLALPGILTTAILPWSGLTAAASHESRSAAREAPAQDSPCFWPLFILGVLLSMAVAMLYSLLSVHLAGVFGEKEGVAACGRALFLIGLFSACGSYLWGFLSERVSPFLIIACGQALCIPVFFWLLGAPAPAEVMLLAAPLGLLFGFYPLVATMARRARGLTPGLRSGLIIGGVWGVSSLPVFAAGLLMRMGVSTQAILHASMLPLAGAGALAVSLFVQERRRDRGQQA